MQPPTVPSHLLPCPPCHRPQSEAHEATKAQLAAALESSAALQGELAALQAQHEAACAAKSELLNEKGQLEKRVGGGWGAGLRAPSLPHAALGTLPCPAFSTPVSF